MIRPVFMGDLPTLQVIEEATQHAPWSLAAFERCFEARYPGWVMEESGEVIGFLLVSLTAGECHILNLCIRPDRQRQGWGRQLLEYGLDWAKSMKAAMIYLEVRRSNHSAIQLYLKMHFKQIGERRQYYTLPKGGKEDALVFARDIGTELLLESDPDFGR